MRQHPGITTVGRPWSPHRDIYHFLLRRSWTTFFVLVALMFLATNAVFALLYSVQARGITHVRPHSFEDSFFFSIQTMATIGYGTMVPATRYAHILVTMEAFIGLCWQALVAGITFAKFSRPTSRVMFSQKMVIYAQDGIPHLMFRIANWRRSQVLEARLRFLLVLSERTAHGDLVRRPQEVPLVRDQNSLFGLTWMVMHRIDTASPFSGPDIVRRLAAAGAQIVVTLFGVDETIGQGIHARHSYSPEDIVLNARFRDIVTDLPDGSRRLDYRLFHEIE